MISLISHRFFHSTRRVMATTRSSALGKLRKSTGYTMSNCKKALDLFPADIGKAEEWLHAEAKKKGWAKWAKIQSRSATQGLIAVFSKDTIGVMVEINCETDFVARNAEFQQFVENVLTGCINHTSSLSVHEDITKDVLEEEQLHSLKFESVTVGELVASAVSKFNEKTVTKRAICYKVQTDVCLSSHSHPTINSPNLNGAMLGKYGALLAYKKKENTDIDPKELGFNICQHIIGLNPSSLGHLTEKDISDILNKKDLKDVECDEHIHSEEATNFDGASSQIIQSEGIKIVANAPIQNIESLDSQNITNTSGEEGEEDGLETGLKDTEETRLLFQPFLFDSNVTVGETLLKSGIEVLDFERFECGENLVDTTQIAESASV